MTEAEALCARLTAAGEWVSLDGRVRESAAARVLGVTAKTIRRWREAGQGPPFLLIGNRLTFRVCDLVEWLNQRRHDPQASNGQTKTLQHLRDSRS